MYLLIFVVRNPMFKSLSMCLQLERKKIYKKTGGETTPETVTLQQVVVTGAAGWSWRGAIESDDPGVKPFYYATP